MYSISSQIHSRRELLILSCTLSFLFCKIPVFKEGNLKTMRNLKLELPLCYCQLKSFQVALTLSQKTTCIRLSESDSSAP